MPRKKLSKVIEITDIYITEDESIQKLDYYKFMNLIQEAVHKFKINVRRDPVTITINPNTYIEMTQHLKEMLNDKSFSEYNKIMGMEIDFDILCPKNNFYIK